MFRYHDKTALSVGFVRASSYKKKKLQISRSDILMERNVNIS